MIEHLGTLFDAITTVASEIITISEIAKDVVEAYNQKANKVVEPQHKEENLEDSEELFDNEYDYSNFHNNVPPIDNFIDIRKDKVNALKKYLIIHLWSLPTLLLHYGITANDIDEVITPFERSFKRVNKIDLVDSAKLQLIYNDLSEKFPHSELVSMGIYTEDGLLRINPVDVLYSKKEKSPAELAEIELLKNADSYFNKDENENEDLEMDQLKYSTALTMVESGIIKTKEDLDYINTLISTLPESKKEEIKNRIKTKKASM